MTTYRHQVGEHVVIKRAKARRRAANAASLLGMCLCVAAGISLAAGGGMVVAGLLFSVGGACDILDGVLARDGTDGVRSTGAFIDSVCDKIGEAAMLGGLLVALQNRQDLQLLVGAYVLGTLSSYVKATAGEHGLKIAWPEVRYFGRAGRAVVLAATLILSDAVTTVGTMSWLTLGFSVLLTFNAAALAWRLGRIAWVAHELARSADVQDAEPPRHSADQVEEMSAQSAYENAQPVSQPMASVR